MVMEKSKGENVKNKEKTSGRDEQDVSSGGMELPLL